MKNYIIEIKDNQKEDKENLMQIIKALAGVGLKVKQVGIQKLKPITLNKKT